MNLLLMDYADPQNWQRCMHVWGLGSRTAPIYRDWLWISYSTEEEIIYGGKRVMLNWPSFGSLCTPFVDGVEITRPGSPPISGTSV